MSFRFYFRCFRKEVTSNNNLKGGGGKVIESMELSIVFKKK